jgi:hypothetical protein
VGDGYKGSGVHDCTDLSHESAQDLMSKRPDIALVSASFGTIR